MDSRFQQSRGPRGFSSRRAPASPAKLDLASVSALSCSGSDVVERGHLNGYCGALAELFGSSRVACRLKSTITKQPNRGGYQVLNIVETESNVSNAVSVVCLEARWSNDQSKVLVTYVQNGISFVPTAPSAAQLASNGKLIEEFLADFKQKASHELHSATHASLPKMLAFDGPPMEMPSNSAMSLGVGIANECRRGNASRARAISCGATPGSGGCGALGGDASRAARYGATPGRRGSGVFGGDGMTGKQMRPGPRLQLEPLPGSKSTAALVQSQDPARSCLSMQDASGSQPSGGGGGGGRRLAARNHF